MTQMGRFFVVLLLVTIFSKTELERRVGLSEDITQMAHGDNLGEFEQLILAALVMVGDNAYGITVHKQVEKLADGVRLVSLGSVYTTLDRLEQKGYVKSWFSDPTGERGGRSKRFFEITGPGELALKNSLKLTDNILKGLATQACARWCAAVVVDQRNRKERKQ